MTLRGVLATLVFLSVIFVAPVTVVSSLLEEDEQRAKASEEARNWGQATQSVATFFAILIGGYWTYSVFVLRGSDMTHVQIKMELKGMMKVTGATRVAVVSVKLKNGGQVAVTMTDCRAGIRYFTREESGSLDHSPITSSSVAHSGESRWIVIFDERDVGGLQPGEEKTEEVLFKVKEPGWFEVGVQFIGEIKRDSLLLASEREIQSSSRMFVDTRTIEKRKRPGSPRFL